MSLHAVLDRVETSLRVRYPPSFQAAVETFVELASSSKFQRVFPMTRPLLELEEVREARNRVGGRLLPFMVSEAPAPDIYAFEPALADLEPKVVIWCEHTTVHVWPDFPNFISWLRQTCGQDRSVK